MALFATALAGALVALWLAPSLRPALAATVGRDIAALLDARSPGGRIAGVWLTKVKQALAPLASLRGSDPSARKNRRSRLIPRRPASSDVPAALAPEDIALLVGPLKALESAPLVSEPAIGPALPGTPPLVLFGIGGGGGAGSALPPVTSANPGAEPATIAATAPVAPVPEPSTWLSMVAGFGIAGAALRRRKRSPRAVAQS